MSLRGDLIVVARRMLALGLVTGTFGNVSCREGKRVLITPSALDYEAMRPEDLVVLDAHGSVVEGFREPSSEYRLHLAIYDRFPGTGAIVHTHSRGAVAFAADATELVPSPGGVLRASVPVAAFEPPGTQELADQAARLLVEGRVAAVILEGHGIVGLGRDLDEAFRVCRAVEEEATRALDREAG